MSKKLGPPKEPTLFAQLLGVKELGVFDSTTNTYTCLIESLNVQAVNFFRTLHGGAIMGLLDDVCGTTIYFRYGINSAITISAESVFHKPIRPISAVKIKCRIIKEEGTNIIMEADLESGGVMVSKMKAIWERRY